MSNKVCTRCCMDTSDTQITFDSSGVCNHCHEWDSAMRQHTVSGEAGLQRLKQIAEKIRSAPIYVKENQLYDCVMGFSGGVDSSYAAYWAKRLGLHPYAISVDNGYNTAESNANVQAVCNYLGTPLHNIVLNRAEFTDLQLSYLKAGVINLETPSDMAINSLVHKTASDLNLRYIISGQNIATEWTMPKSWGWDNNDAVNLRSIHKHFGAVPLRTFPVMGHAKYQYYVLFKHISTVPILNYVSYNRSVAKEICKREFGWIDYGPKHHESIITRWYQCYVLPVYWNIDKRKAHLSCLIRNGEISREQALTELAHLPCSAENLREDFKFVCNYLNLPEQQMIELLDPEQHTSHETWGVEGKPNELVLSLYHAYQRVRGKR